MAAYRRLKSLNPSFPYPFVSSALPVTNRWFNLARLFWLEYWSIWRGVRVVEGARLESVYTLTRIEGSNPSLSASQSPNYLIVRALFF